MTYSDHWREHCLPRVERVARVEAIHVTFGELPDLRPISYAEALDRTMRAAVQWGAHRLPEPIWWDLESYIGALIATTIDTIERARNVR